MCLKKIKLEDLNHLLTFSILIPICGTMNAIFGFNGCGRSSVVDVIRWVIREASEKQLRGQSISDVILAVLLRYHVNLLGKDFY